MSSLLIATALGLPVVLLGLAVTQAEGKAKYYLFGLQITLFVVQIGFAVSGFLNK